MSKDSFFEANSIIFWQDTEALREFKNGLDPNSVRPGSCLSSWDFTLDPCDNLFTCGFRCDLVISTMSRVTELALDQAGYVGSLASTSWILLHLLLLLLHTQLARPEPNHRLRTPTSSPATRKAASSPPRATHAPPASPGVLALKALKLSDSFMELYRNNNFTGEKLREKNLSWVDIFEEIPIKVSNSALISAFMTELEADSPVTQCDFDRLQLSTNPFMARNVEFLIECMDDLSMEQQKFQFYYRNLSRQQSQQQAWLQKRRTENMARKAAGEELLPEEDPSNPIFKPIPEPSRLDSFLITNQISNYCNQINGNGSNKSAISKHIADTYGELPPAHMTLLSHLLNKMKQSGQLISRSSAGGFLSWQI
ncbi:unnamed protein product [Camellia sinensis]